MDAIVTTGPVRLLLVDDDEDDYVITDGLIADHGAYRLDWVPDFASGLAAIEADLHDVYLIDYRLGADDGLDLVRAARQLPGRWRPIVMLTGHGSPEIDARALLEGADDYLPKISANTEMLDRVIRHVIGRARSLEQLRDSEARHRMLFQQNPMPMWIYDRETLSFLAVNDAAVSHYGYSHDEFLAMTIRDIRPAEDVEPLLQSLAAPVTQGLTTGEWRHCKKCGEIITVSITSHGIDYSGRPARLVIANDITAQKLAEARLAHQATHDALSGLPNRALLADRLGQALLLAGRTHHHVAVLCMDLDNFKVVNDSLGHIAGDRLLAQVARRLTEALAREHTVARFGGDEFVILCKELAEESDIDTIVRDIQTLMAAPFTLDEEQIYVTASIGIAMSPRDSEDADRLLRHADLAMYRAKERGRNTAQFFLPELDASVGRRRTIANRLHLALERNEFRVVYQPQVNAADGVVTGFEALIRWHHPEDGLIAPTDFIGVAEETGLIVRIGAWVLHEACARAAKWQASGGQNAPSVAVNVSMVQFRQEGFIGLVRRTLAVTGLAPQRLELEITESLIMDGAEQFIEALTQLAELGIRIAIDDFGTGYSSLSYLTRLPIHRIKIDRSFVRDITVDPHDATVCRTIIAMARNLGLTSVAEGVETRAQADSLRYWGCDQMQGWLFSKAIDADAVQPLLQQVYIEPST